MLAVVFYAPVLPHSIKITSFDGNKTFGVTFEKIKTARKNRNNLKNTLSPELFDLEERLSRCCNKSGIDLIPGNWMANRYKDDELSLMDESLAYTKAANRVQPDERFTQLTKDYDLWVAEVKKLHLELPQQVEVYRRALEHYPSHVRLLADYATLLSWNGDYQKAIIFYHSKLESIKLPVYALNAIALAAREIKNYELSKKLYTKSLAQDAHYIETLLGLAALETRNEKYNNAETYVRQALEIEPKNQEALSLLAYIYNQQKDQTLNKIQVYEQLLALDPEQTDIIRLKTLSLLDMGLIETAEKEMLKHQELYGNKDWLRLYSAKNTKAIRRIIDDGKAIEDKNFVHQALSSNQDYISLLTEQKSIDKHLLSLAYADRILLLNQLGMSSESVAVAEESELSVDVLPDYGLTALADAYHSQQQPAKSLSLIKQAMETGQIAADNDKALKTAYYAALDTGDIEQAQLFLQRLVDKQPKWRYSSDGLRRKFNSKYNEVILMQTMHKAFTNDLVGAEQGLQELLDVAPNNNEYRQNLADVLRWRGFVNKSNRELDIIQATDSEYQPSQVSRIYNQLAHRRFEEADSSLGMLGNGQLNSRIRRLTEDYDIATDARFTLSVSGGDSEGSNFSSQDRNYEAKIYSSLFGSHWRSFATTQNYHSEFFGESGSTVTQGVGAQYESQWFIAELELFSANGLDGVELSSNYQFFLDDHLSFDLIYQSFNKQTPVRALLTDVTVDLSSASLNYRLDEYQNYSLSWQSSSFSDGNDRESIGLSGSQIIYYDYNQRLKVTETLHRTENSLDTNRLYFNPTAALTLSAAITYDELFYKNADTSLWHGLTFDGGFYQQKGFERGGIWAINYHHQWQLGRRSFLNYSIGYSQRVYDGQTEKGPVYNLSYGVTF